MMPAKGKGVEKGGRKLFTLTRSGEEHLQKASADDNE
jgi:DNA-binding PadR family transcriptional regulator